MPALRASGLLNRAYHGLTAVAIEKPRLRRFDTIPFRTPSRIVKYLTHDLSVGWRGLVSSKIKTIHALSSRESHHPVRLPGFSAICRECLFPLWLIVGRSRPHETAEHLLFLDLFIAVEFAAIADEPADHWRQKGPSARRVGPIN